MESLLRTVRRNIRRIAALPRKAAVYNSQIRRASDGPPIFIVGCHRSGTTLLRKILNSHSRIACPGETHFLKGMLKQLKSPFYIRGLEGLDIYRKEAAVNIREFALNYYESYLYRAGKARWADKTPTYTTYLSEIHEVFGDVRFIYLLRHGMDVVHSIRNIEWFSRYYNARNLDKIGRLKAAAEHWIELTDSYENFSVAHPEVCHTVRYETLTEHPEQTVRGIMKFIGEPWEPETLDYQAFPQSDSDIGDRKSIRRDCIISGNSGNYRSWPIQHQQIIADMLKEHLDRYGYEVNFCDTVKSL